MILYLFGVLTGVIVARIWYRITVRDISREWLARERQKAWHGEAD